MPNCTEIGAGGGTPRVKRPQRDQIEFRACCWNDLLPEDHQARIVWDYVKSLNLSALYERIKAEVDPGLEVHYGTMIEIPRACLLADRMALAAEFFSFGTNDLTQMGFGFSRDDIGGFLGDYVSQGILEADPFQTIDQAGIGQLIEMAVEKGRAARDNLKVGICGEQGGDPASVEFCFKTGLNYVSCSPYRVPIARLAAAQAAIAAGAESRCECCCAGK